MEEGGGGFHAKAVRKGEWNTYAERYEGILHTRDHPLLEERHDHLAADHHLQDPFNQKSEQINERVSNQVVVTITRLNIEEDETKMF